MRMITCMCGHPKDAVTCQKIELTAQEKKVLIDQGRTPPDTLYYCPPCYKLLQHPEHGPILMRGIFEQQLRQAGVSNAKQLADKYYTRLKELQREAKHGPTS